MRDKIAILAALLGVLLMALALAFRVNPCEGSVIPDFLRDSPRGQFFLMFLVATCMPAWILVVETLNACGMLESVSWFYVCGIILLVQGFAYFWIGKIISFGIHKTRNRKAL